MKKVTLHISRFNPEYDDCSYFQTFEHIEYDPMDTILDVLLNIRYYKDSTLSFRYSCKCTICGSCAMRINGVSRLACETRVADAQKDGIITVEPLQHFTVIKDLIADIEPMLTGLSIVAPWLMRDHTHPIPEKEFNIKPETISQLLERLDRCILCGACHSDSEIMAVDKSVISPVSMVKSLKYMLHPMDALAESRIKQLVDLGLLKHPDELGARCPKGIHMTQDVILPLKQRAKDAQLL